MQRGPEADDSSSYPHASTLYSRLAPLLRSPWPGCVFVYAPSHSHQSQALQDVRRLVQQTTNAYAAELHPNLIGSRASDIAREVQAAAPSSSSSSSAFLSSTTSIYPPRPSTSAADETCQVLIIPSAHLLRSSHSPLVWSQLLDPLRGYATILLSGLPLDRWRTADGIEDATPYRPLLQLSAQGGDDAAAAAAQRQTALLASLPSAQELQSHWAISSTLAHGLDDSRIRTQFLTWTLAALDADVGAQWDVDETCYLVAPIWIAMATQVQRSGGEQVGDDDEESRLGEKLKELKSGTPLFTILTPLIRSAIKHLHTRSMGVQTWIRSHGGVTSSSSSSSASRQPAQTPAAHPPLSPLSSLLLLSAFLASHLAPKTDVRFFLRDETILAASSNGSRKTRRGGRRRPAAVNGSNGASSTHSNPLLLGPRPFTAQRMLYLFQNLCKEFDVRLSSRSIRAQRDLAARQRKRRRRRLDEEQQEDGEDDREDDEAEEAALHSLAVWHAVQGLVAGKLLVLVSPPAPAPIVTTQSSSSSAVLPEAICLPAIPTRLEYLNQASLRCNCLREEVRQLVLGQRQAQRWATRAEGGGAADANGWLDDDDRGDDDDDEDDDDDDDDGRLVSKRDDGGEVFGVRTGGGASSWRQRRKEWWTRVEEVGL